MVPDAIASDLLDFFKALADPNRLKIVGMLAQRPHTVEELAGNLGLGASTVSHHLARLTRAGLTEARAEGYYSVYSLRLDELRAMAERMHRREELTELARDVDVDSYDRKVLASFTDREGRFTAFPAQEKKMLVLLRHCARAFEPGVRYPEKQVNEILGRFHADTAALRRELIADHLMARERGVYWRVEA